MQLVFRVGAVLAAVIMVSACEDPGKVVRVPVSATAAASTTAATPTTSTIAQTDDQRLAMGKLAEGMRIAEVLALPTDIDPAYRRHGNSNVLHSARLKVSAGHHNAIAAVADRHGLITGFVSERSNGGSGTADTDWLTHGVMRFRDAATATAAAADFAVAATEERGLLQSGEWTPATVPGSPSTRLVLLEDRGRLTGMGFTPQGGFVVFTKVRAGGRPDIERTITKALEQQRPLLDSFTPTPERELATLPYDPDGIFELSVGDNSSGRGAYRQHGALLFAEDQQAAVALYREVGVVAMANKGTTVYRTGDAAGAARLAAATSAAIAAAWTKSVAPAPADVPGATCLTDGNSNANAWVCVVTGGRYVAEVWGKTQDETHAAAREQQRVLAAAK
ncbi:hypothetical protein [Nocardia sp. XZ_19_231]|uniref:DUF7373 family lipoprotein n=1 Tax=Nocardia sp. XZ_19_231 TaxID=2769252 RepID=UPI00188E487B|nr:hypothetical protein [Nocardia sp. XZ_19_231]